MPSKLSHADSPTLPTKLPWDSASASPPPIIAPVDLTRDVYQDDRLPDTSRSRLERTSHEGKRRNSEATPVPDPALGFRSAARPMTKPGAGAAFKPLNTMKPGTIANEINPARAQRSTTYGRLDRNKSSNTKSIGVQRHGGQEAYIAKNGLPNGSAPPMKRRRTEKPNGAIETIEVESSDDETQPTVRARPTPTPRSPSKFSSRSPHSTTSRHSRRSPSRVSQQRSGFLGTEELMGPKRLKPRRKGANGHDAGRGGSNPEVPFVGAGTQPQEQSFDIHDDSLESPPARTLILQSHEQDVKNGPSRNRVQLSTGSTSKYFNPKNLEFHSNESTANTSTKELYDSIARTQGASSAPQKNLRDFRHAEQVDPIQDSEDELAKATPNTSKPRRKQSPSKARSKGGSGKEVDALGKIYALKYVQTYDLRVESEDLQLRQDRADPKHFRITITDSEQYVQTLGTINTGRVNRCDFDNLDRIRLQGPATEGERYWFDLQFAHFDDFLHFRDTYVTPECLQNVVNMTNIMVGLFKKPLQRNDKIGKSPMVGEETRTGSAQDRQAASRKPTLLGTLKNGAREDNRPSISVKERPRQPSRTTQAASRAIRSTRATAPLYDLEPQAEKEPDRYSVTVGLGKPWAQPFDYSISSGFLKRRKATVNWNDLETLDEGQFLNDNIMTFYMLYLYSELKVNIDRVYFFNTHFFPTLTKKVKGQDGINYDGVKSWTKRDDVFSYDYIVVPINENLHWYLGIICNVNNIKRKLEHEVLEEDPQDLDLEAASIYTSDVPVVLDNDSPAARQSSVAADTATPDGAADAKDIDNDDVNLFEQEKELNLIDRNAESAGEHSHLSDAQSRPEEELIVEEVRAADLSSVAANGASSLSASGEAKQASKKKTKGKPSPQKKDPEKPVIMILDSLRGTHSQATRALRQWLEAEGLDKRALTVEIDAKGHYPKDTQIPMQTNFSDCGLYALGYLRKFFSDPDEFRVKLLQQQMSAESDWPEMNPSEMRKDIRELIFRLNEAKHGERKEAHKAKKTSSGKDAAAPPVETRSKETTAALKEPSATQVLPAAAAPKATEPAPTTIATTGNTPTPPIDTPRLGSPFKSGYIQGMSETPSKTPERARRSPAKRTGSPEVRVPAKTPHIDLSQYDRYDGASDQSQRSGHQAADLTSPLQSRRLQNNDDGTLRMPLAKKTQPSSLAGSSRARTRSGSHDDPIDLDDSQDLDAPAKKPSKPSRRPPTEIIELDRSQESARAPTRRVKPRTQSSQMNHRGGRQQKINRDDSIREGDRYEWQENHDVMRALDASLKDQNEQFARAANHQPYDPDDLMEDSFEEQLRSAHILHTAQEIPETQEAQAMDVDGDDAVVPESPAQRRSSPPVDVDMTD